MLPPGFEPGSRADLALTGYKPAALPIELRERIFKQPMSLLGLEPKSHGLKGRCLAN